MRSGYHRYPRRRPAVLITSLATVCFLTMSLLLLDVISNPFRRTLAPSNIESDSFSSLNLAHVIVFAKNADSNPRVLANLRETLRSIFKHASIFLHVHILANSESHEIISESLLQLEQETDIYFKHSLYHLERIEKNEQVMVKLLRKYFFNEPVPKYDDDIFFLTPGFHRIFPDIDRAIFLDTDLRFRDDIRKLWKLFSAFGDGNAIGIAHDLQPMYRHKFSAYREKNPGTDVGTPNPGKQGFNSGVMLMDFNRIRKSLQYNLSFFDSKLKSLREKYEFYGDLGHQDFFTLLEKRYGVKKIVLEFLLGLSFCDMVLGMEYPELFYLLHCSWNRQLEMTWATKVSGSIFDEYHKCEGEIKVYHANAGSELPPDVTV